MKVETQKLIFILVLSIAMSMVSSTTLTDALQHCNIPLKDTNDSKTEKNKNEIIMPEFYIQISRVYTNCHTALTKVETHDKRIVEVRNFILVLIKLQQDILILTAQKVELQESRADLEELDEQTKERHIVGNRLKVKIEQLSHSNPINP